MPILQKVTFEYSNFIFFNYFQPYSNIPKAKVSVRGIFLLYKTLFPRQFSLSISKLNYKKDTFPSIRISKTLLFFFLLSEFQYPLSCALPD